MFIMRHNFRDWPSIGLNLRLAIGANLRLMIP
ncbi:MAG: hypothetical protein [Podoviridae sp. ctg2L5]|nr:MAG: hypothetical protein [Podoviridae sp. ctg2L5]